MLLERRRRRIAAIVGFEVRRLAPQQFLLGREPGIGVFGRRARHRRRPLDQRGQRLGGKIGGGDARRALAGEEAQPDLLAVGAGHVLQRAEADLHFGRGVADIEGVGGVGPGLARGLDQPGRARFRFIDI